MSAPRSSRDLFWIEAAFLPDSLALYDWLASHVAWDDRIKARKVASFGVPYNYSGIVWPAAPFPHPILTVLNGVAERVGFQPNNCLANFYPDGAATMGFHRDATAELVAGTGIAVLSLGADRDISFRPESNKAAVERHRLTSGSLLYMTAGMQVGWKHGIEATDLPVGGRISLTFRAIKPEL